MSILIVGGLNGGQRMEFARYMRPGDTFEMMESMTTPTLSDLNADPQDVLVDLRMTTYVVQEIYVTPRSVFKFAVPWNAPEGFLMEALVQAYEDRL